MDVYDNRPFEARFVRAYREGSAYRWQSCAAAVRVKEKGDVMKVARQLALSPAQLNNMAQAGLCYREMRRYAGRTGNVGRLHKMRKLLTYSHFVMAGRYMFLREVPAQEVFDVLEIAANEGASTRDVASYLVGEYGDSDENDNMWMPVLRRTVKELDNLLNNFATPYDVKMRIREIKAELAVYLREL